MFKFIKIYKYTNSPYTQIVKDCWFGWGLNPISAALAGLVPWSTASVVTASKHDSEGPTFSFHLGPNFPATFLSLCKTYKCHIPWYSDIKLLPRWETGHLPATAFLWLQTPLFKKTPKEVPQILGKLAHDHSGYWSTTIGTTYTIMYRLLSVSLCCLLEKSSKWVSYWLIPNTLDV